MITDKKLQIIECNRNFAELFGADTVEAFDACPGLAGADLSRIVPFYALFESSLQSGRDVRDFLIHGADDGDCGHAFVPFVCFTLFARFR